MAAPVRQRTVFLFGALFMLGVGAYLCFSLLWRAPFPLPWRLGLTALLLSLSQCPIGIRVLILQQPKITRRILLVCGFLSSAFTILFWLVLIRDALLCLLFLFSEIRLFPSVQAICLSIPVELGMAATSLALAALCLCHVLRVPRTVQKEINLPLLPKTLEGLRLAHLSDLHIGSSVRKNWLETVVNRVNALDTDFVFITGDLVDGPVEQLAEQLHPLARLRAKYGVLLCPGNHDYDSGLRHWVSLWKSWGLCTLINEHKVFCVRGENVIAGGVADPHAASFHGFDTPNTRRAFKGAPDGFRLLLSHRPGEAKENASLGCQLQLSGHTHGGQFFFLFPLISRLNGGFRVGVYKIGPMLLHVCPGTGIWGYAPMRLGVPAEISLLELTREKTPEP